MKFFPWVSEWNESGRKKRLEGGINHLQEDLTIVEILGLAIRAERESYQFYKKLSMRVSNPIVKEKFVALAREERRHRHILEDLYNQKGKKVKFSIPKKSLKQRVFPSNWESLSHEELLKMAIRKEKEAISFYRKALKKATDRSGRFILQYLSDFERNHKKSLEQELKALTEYPMWWDHEGPGIQFIGP